METKYPLFKQEQEPTTLDALFDAANPGIYEAFVKAAREVRSTGREKYSAYTIRERIRWHFEIEKGDREFLFNNSWTPSLARRLMREDPSFAGFFETRKSKHDTEAA